MPVFLYATASLGERARLYKTYLQPQQMLILCLLHFINEPIITDIDHYLSLLGQAYNLITSLCLPFISLAASCSYISLFS